MTRLLIDTSVLVKWFHSAGESELAEARLIRSAHMSGEVTAHVLDLALYEVGNVLVRGLGWEPDDVADQLDDLLAICGAPLALAPGWLRGSAFLAHQHGLSFYDSAWAASATALEVPLVSADRRLVDAGLAESPTSIVRRLQLTARRANHNPGREGSGT
jgi:predicted nucleic acid-binding protein